MPDKHVSLHWSFWLIGAVALIWNAMGCANFFVQMDADVLAQYRPSEQAIVAHRPMWATTGFALGVFGGALGSVLLLLRMRVAIQAFIVSLVGIVVATVHTLSIGVAFGMGEIAGIVFMPVAVAVFLFWYAWFADRKAWLRTQGERA